MKTLINVKIGYCFPWKYVSADICSEEPTCRLCNEKDQTLFGTNRFKSVPSRIKLGDIKMCVKDTRKQIQIIALSQFQNYIDNQACMDTRTILFYNPYKFVRIQHCHGISPCSIKTENKVLSLHISRFS